MDTFYHHLNALSDLHGWPGTLIVAVIVGSLALLAHFLGAIVVRRLAAKRAFVSELIVTIHQPARLALVLFAFEFAWRLAPDDLHAIETVRRINTIALIGSLTWLAVAWVNAIGRTVIKLHPTLDSVQARRVVTQTRVLTRSVIFLVVLLGLSFALMTIPDVRQVGTSLLASAGIAGVVAGVAARPVLGNFISGLQLAFSQPLRIDDVLI
ncbi:MAG TPA: mechanosensitive ion channel family protein, partial [Rhodocyclaceae bacterium]|nr:mechanosensitive ion channel family protein [Rhodocyclaceae bacterium]